MTKDKEGLVFQTIFQKISTSCAIAVLLRNYGNYKYILFPEDKLRMIGHKKMKVMWLKVFLLHD